MKWITIYCGFWWLVFIQLVDPYTQIREGVQKNRFFQEIVLNSGPHPPIPTVQDSKSRGKKVVFNMLFKLNGTYYFFKIKGHFWSNIHMVIQDSALAWAKKKNWIWASLFTGQFCIGIRTPQKNFQIYRPINDSLLAISILGVFTM